jgi:hypothetical protein|tara:strand:- start:922 stop:1797 length:876 start_codon:yes stop_codon:yes gene_type:complete
MYSLGVNRLGVTNTNTTNLIKSLFAAGEKGAWYDPSDLASMFQVSNGTTAAVVGQPVGYIADKSGNANHAIQATDAKRPILRVDAVGALYLDFDGDCLQAASFDLTGTDELSFFTGHKKVGTANSILIEHSADSPNTNGTFRVNAPAADTNVDYVFSSGGTTRRDLTVTGGYEEPLTAVTSYTAKIATPLQTVSINRNTDLTETGAMGSGDYTSQTLNIGSRDNAASLPFVGRLYSIIVRGKDCTAAEILKIESYVGQKTGIATQIDDIATLDLNFEANDYAIYNRNGGAL